MEIIRNNYDVLDDPFSTTTEQPKIPDGHAVMSMGAKRNVVQQLDFEEYDVRYNHKSQIRFTRHMLRGCLRYTRGPKNVINVSFGITIHSSKLSRPIQQTASNKQSTTKLVKFELFLRELD